MDNPTMARLLDETADLLEIDGGDGFRIRSYRRAAEAAEQTTVDLMEASSDTARLLEIPGIGKGMASNLQAIAETGTMPLRDELLAKYGAGVLELLKLPGSLRQSRRESWRACRAWEKSRLRNSARGSKTTGEAPGATVSMLRKKPRKG
jgi:DNA polymerase (family 10)